MLLRDRLFADTGEDILAPRIDDVSLGATTLRGARMPRLGLTRAGLASGLLEGSTVVGGGGGVTGVVVGGTGTGTTGTGTTGTGTTGTGTTGTGATGTIVTGFGSAISIIDRRIVQRPKQVGVVSGRYGRTEIPGSYSFTITATGFSPTCKTRFVRKDFASVAVVDKG